MDTTTTTPTLFAKVAAKVAANPVPTAADVARNLAYNGRPKGNSQDRRNRTARLLAEFGDGATCPCVYCGGALTAATLTQDRIYTKHQGGSYRMANLLPACANCNRKRSDAPFALRAVVGFTTTAPRSSGR